jgi:hypothetical protein
MKWFEILYVCMKPSKVHDPDTKHENIENVNVFITNDRLTNGSINYSESCNSILSDLSTIDEE